MSFLKDLHAKTDIGELFIEYTKNKVTDKGRSMLGLKFLGTNAYTNSLKLNILE
jgi:hypothetical protein